MEIRYEENLLYQISSTKKYFDKLFEQYFKELNLGITGVEHFTLCVIMQTKDCCQRDLAKIILKDRANTGKLVNKLEARGLIKVCNKTKNNRPAKILSVTKEGKRLCEAAYAKTQPMVDKIKEEITPEIMETMIKHLASFRQAVKKSVKIDI